MKFKKIIEFIEMCFGVIVIALGLSLLFKSGIGQTAYAALANNLSKILGYKVGTVIIIFNVSCVLGQIILLGKKFKRFQILQIAIAYLNGMMVNVFCYNFPPIAKLTPNNYILQWLILLSGVIGLSFGIAIMRSMDSLNMPLEEFAFVLAEKIDYPLSTVRQWIDFICIIGCFVAIFLFKLDFSTVREGTWCSMLLLGRSFAYTFPVTRRVLEYVNGKLFKFIIVS